MATIYLQCNCGKKFIVEIEGSGEITCPQCDLIWKRFYNQTEHTYNIIVKDK